MATDPRSSKKAKTTEPWEAVNEAMETIEALTEEFAGDQKTAAATLLGHLDRVAKLAQEAHNAAEAGRPDDVTPCVTHAYDALAAVKAAAAADALRPSVGALEDAVTTAVDAAKQAEASVPMSLVLAYEVRDAAAQARVNVFLGKIKAESSLGTVLALHQVVDPANDDLKAIKMTETNARVKLRQWWLTYNRDTSIAKAMLGTDDAAAAACAFAGTLEALCDDLKLPRKPLENPVVTGLKAALPSVCVSKAGDRADELAKFVDFAPGASDPALSVDLIDGAKKRLPEWEAQVKEIDTRIDNLVANQTAAWIDPPFTGSSKDTGWFEWVAYNRDNNKSEQESERPLYHVLRAALLGQDVTFEPSSGGGQTGGDKKMNKKHPCAPFLTKGFVSRGNVDFYATGSGGGQQGWELKRPGSLTWDYDRWQALVQCDAIMGADRRVGYHVLTDLRSWYFMQVTRKLKKDSQVRVTVRHLMLPVSLAKPPPVARLKEIAHLVLAAWILNQHPDNALDPASELGKAVITTGDKGWRASDWKSEPTKGAGAGAGAGDGAGDGDGDTPPGRTKTTKRGPEPGDPEHDRTPVLITPDLFPAGSWLGNMVAKHQNRACGFDVFSGDELAYILAQQ